MSGPSIKNPANASPQWAACSAAAALVFGRQAVTASDVALPSVAVNSMVWLKATKANTGIVSVGGVGVTTATGYELAAGETVVLPVSNISMIHVIGTAGDHVEWLAL